MLGHAAADEEDYETYRALWEESLELVRRQGRVLHADDDPMLAWAYDELGSRTGAGGSWRTMLAEARAAGDKPVEVHALESLAIDAAQEGRVDEAADASRSARAQPRARRPIPRGHHRLPLRPSARPCR